MIVDKPGQEKTPRRPRRKYPNAPIAAVGAVVLDHDSVLLVRRGKDPHKGAWSLPGGAVELGETLQQAVCREVLEETGLVVEPAGVLEVLDSISLDEQKRVAYHYVLVDYLCRIRGGSLCRGSDAKEVRWLARSQLDTAGLAQRTVAVILEAYRKEGDGLCGDSQG